MVGSASQGGVKSSNVLDENMAALDPEWERRPYCGQHGGVYSRGLHGHSSWYAAANRLFFRTAGHLWCIGDPAQPFPASAKIPASAKSAR